MSEIYKYKTIVAKSKEIKENVEKQYKLGVTSKWGYYIAKAILSPKKDVKKITFNNAPNPNGTNISRQILKADYVDMAKRLVNYVEKHHVLPNYVTYKTFKVRTRVYVYMFAKILVYYNEHQAMPNYVNITSKAFTTPNETGNKVYDYFVDKTGKAYKSIDDLLAYVQKNFSYEYYFDDKKSNKQVTDSKAGNCTDLLQWLCNMVEPMGYEWKCIHVKCRVSGTGHVFGKFRKKGSSAWFTRDIASVSDGGAIDSVWCQNGIVLGENPKWWMDNLHR